MPFVRVVKAGKKKFLLKQWLILTPLSLSGLFLTTQAVRSISNAVSRNSNVSTAQTAPVATQGGAPRTAMRTANPSGRTSNPPPPATGTGSNPGDPFGGGNPGGTNLGGGGGTGGGGGPTGAVPVDGGLSLLLAAGLGYGARKAYQYRTNKSTDV